MHAPYMMHATIKRETEREAARERERERSRERESEGGREGGRGEGGREGEREREIERVYKTKMSPRINSLCKWQAQSHPPEAHSPQSITRKLNRENA